MALNVIIEVLGDVIEVALKTLIMVFGAWLTAKLGKRKELENINAAQQELMGMAHTTVGELMQTTVEKMKAASADGKLSDDEIKSLQIALVTGTIEKMSGVSLEVLRAAGVDINKLIIGAGDDWINSIKDRPRI